MRKSFIAALALAVGALGLSAGAAPASAAGSQSLDKVRADAMSRLAAGDVETVKHRRYSYGYTGSGWPNGSVRYRRHSRWDRHDRWERRHWSRSDRWRGRRHHW